MFFILHASLKSLGNNFRCHTCYFFCPLEKKQIFTIRKCINLIYFFSLVIIIYYILIFDIHKFKHHPYINSFDGNFYYDYLRKNCKLNIFINFYVINILYFLAKYPILYICITLYYLVSTETLIWLKIH